MRPSTVARVVSRSGRAGAVRHGTRQAYFKKHAGKDTGVRLALKLKISLLKYPLGVWGAERPQVKKECARLLARSAFLCCGGAVRS